MERRRNYSIHCFDTFVLCVYYTFLENERTKKNLYTDCCCSKTSHWNLFLKQQRIRKINFFLCSFHFVRWCAFRSSGICCHASFKYKSFSRSFIYHRVNVYHPLFSLICLHEFQYSADTKWMRFQTISQEHQISFF